MASLSMRRTSICWGRAAGLIEQVQDRRAERPSGFPLWARRAAVPTYGSTGAQELIEHGDRAQCAHEDRNAQLCAAHQQGVRR